MIGGISRLRAGLRAGALLTIALSALVGAGGAPAAGDGTAPSYRIDVAHDAYQIDPQLQLPLTQRWSVPLGAHVSYPLVAEGKIFVTSSNAPIPGSTLYALDEARGQVVWSQQISGSTGWSAAAYDGGRVFVLNADGLLRAFSASAGSPAWAVQLPGQYTFNAPPTASGGVVYASGSGGWSPGMLYAVDETDGSVDATQPVQDGAYSAPTVAGSSVFVSYACDSAYGFSTPTLGYLWHFGWCSWQGGETTVYAGGRLYIADAQQGNRIVDAATGELLGTWDSAFFASPPATDGTTLWTLENAGLYGGGTLVTRGGSYWIFAPDEGLALAPVVVDNGTAAFTVVLSQWGGVYALDTGSGNLVWSAPTPTSTYDPSGPDAGLSAGDGLLLVPTNNVLTAYAGSRPVQMSNGPKAMEGDLKVPAGSTLKVGYDFSIPGKHLATWVRVVNAKAVFAYTCTGGTNAGSFTVSLPDAGSTQDPLNSAAWYPSGTQSDPSVWQASIQVPNVCPAGSLVRLQKGGTFSAGVASTGSQKLTVRWHYSGNGSPGKWSDNTTVLPG